MDYNDQTKSAAKSSEMGSSSSAETECRLLKLPSCLIMDIMSRLPIKTIFSCRCVSKTWPDFISDPLFVKYQLPRSPLCMLTQFLSSYDQGLSGKVQFAHITEKPSAWLFRVDKMMLAPEINLPTTDFDIENSCNGLLCLSHISQGKCDAIYVCNPMLGECISIPVGRSKDCTRHHSCLAFGFSAGSDEYKVLHTFYAGSNSKPDVQQPQAEAEIYTLGTRQWRTIDKVVCALTALDFNCFLHGSIHWVHGYEKGYEMIYVGIASFNFDVEQFSMLSLPPLGGRGGRESVTLSVLNDCLCASFFDCTRSAEELDIWVMKKYGIKESWTKHVTIRNLEYGRNLEPLMFFNNGLIFMLCNGRLVLFHDTKRKFTRDSRIFQIEGNILATAYNPSFVSLKDVAKGEELTMSRTHGGGKGYRFSSEGKYDCTSSKNISPEAKME